MACITEAAAGFPNGNGHIPPECATLAEMLVERGLQHLRGRQVAPDRRGRDEPRLDQAQLAARPGLRPVLRLPRRARPTSGTRTSCTTTTRSTSRSTPEQGYHLSVDLTDRAIEFIDDVKAIAPDRPFFVYYAPGATHAPHHVPQEWADRYRGRFDAGYEAAREQILARQKELGIVPPEHRAAAAQPASAHPSTRHGPDGKPFPALDYTKPWDELSRRRAAAVRPDGRGLCRLPVPRRRADRPAAGSPRGDRASWTTRSSSWSPTTAPAARAARTARSTRTRSPTASPTTWPPTWRCSTSWAARRPTTTTPTAGRWRSTRRSRCGSATRSTAAPAIRASSPGRPVSARAASSATSTTTPSTSSRPLLDCLGVDEPDEVKGVTPDPDPGRQHALQLRCRRTSPPLRRPSSTRCSAPADLARRLESRHHPPRPSAAGAISSRTPGSSTTPTRTAPSCTTSPPSTPTGSTS